MTPRLPVPLRALLALHRFLLARFSDRFPGPWAAETHETSRALVERAHRRDGWMRALLVAAAECADVGRIGLAAGEWGDAPARMLRDVRYAVRRLASRPVRTLSLVLTLAVGIGASTAIFSVVNNTLLKPMMLRDVDGLVRIDDVVADGSQTSNVSPLNAELLRARVSTLDPLIAQSYQPFVLTGSGEPERLRGSGVSEGFVSGLGVEPLLGRAFTSDEHRAGAGAPSVMVSWDLWQRRWGGQPSVIGAVAVLNERPRTVVGVMPRGFHFPYEADVWVPIEYEPTQAEPHYLLVFGRMAPGRSLADVQTELEAISADLRAAAPDANRGVVVRAMPLRDNLVRGYDRTALALLSVVGFLLLVGAVNVASLGLAEAHTRAREMAIRSALGATRRRQIAQLLTESGTLALLGGAVGLGLAVLLRPLLSLLVPPVMGVELAQNTIALDHRVVLFALGAAAMAAAVAGVLPALRAAVRSPAGVLRAGGSVERGGRAESGLVVVGLELALAMVLLTGASAVTVAFVRGQARPLGYQADGVLTLRASLPEERYPGEERRAAVVEELRRRIARVPGVEAVALATGNPARGSWVEMATSADRPDPADGTQSNFRLVTEGFFQSLDVPIISGRALDDRDDVGAPAVVVSRSLARRLWGEESEALGRTLVLSSAAVATERWTVVGVSGDLREEGNATGAVYLPYARHRGRLPAQEIDFFVRASGMRPAALAPEVRAAIHEVDPSLALYGVQPQVEVRSAAHALERAGATLAAGLVGFGLLLSALGVFGVMSNVAARSSRALGVRKALGAGAMRLFVSGLVPTLRAVAAGVGAGAVATWLVNRVLAATIPGLPVPDGILFVGAAAVLAFVAITAALGPVLRAAQVDPVRALRGD